jgi:outer membrane immunogenic protein
MKRLVLALIAVAAFTGSAVAADLPANTYRKAPAVVAPVPTWTGLWISGGFGYGLMNYQHSEYSATTGALFSPGQDTAGKGWLGKVGLGYDYQFMGNFVIGAFADADWSNIGGQSTFACPGGCPGAFAYTGQYKNDWSWAAGGRIGYVALPGLLTYFNAGYTQAHIKQTNYVDGSVGDGRFFGTNSGLALLSQTRGGYFLGGGTEYAISQIPGLFWKNEVRFSEFGNKTNAHTCTVFAGSNCGVAGTTNILQTSHIYEQMATTELVYRFNWGGPLVAKY